MKLILGINNLKYKVIADQLANEIMQCGIDFVNENRKNESNNNYIEIAQKIINIADTIAIGRFTKDRIKDNLDILEEMKDFEINQAIILLQSVKDAYENSRRNIISALKNIGMNEREINWSKFDNHIIIWDDAVKSILEFITQEKIKKIKASKNKEKIDKYKDLVKFIIDKTKNNNEDVYKKIKYLKYWSNTKTTPNYSKNSYSETSNNKTPNNTTSNYSNTSNTPKQNNTTSNTTNNDSEISFLDLLPLLIFGIVTFIGWKNDELMFGIIISLPIMGIVNWIVEKIKKK